MRRSSTPSAARAVGIIVFTVGGILLVSTFSPTAIPLCIIGAVIWYGFLLASNKKARRQIVLDFNALINGTDEPAHMIESSGNMGATLGLHSSSDLSYQIDMWEKPRVYTIKLSKDTRWNSAQAMTLITKLQHLGRLILRIEASPKEIIWQVIDINDIPFSSDEVSRAIRSAYVDAEVSDPELFEAIDVKREYWRRVDFYHQSQEWLRPSLQVNDITKADPLTTIVNGLIDLREDERVSYLVAFRFDDNPTELNDLLQEGYESITTSKTTAVALDILSAAFSENSMNNAVGAGISTGILGTWKGERPDKYPPETMKACMEKFEGFPFMRCFVAIEANSPDPQRLNQFNFFMPFVKQFSTTHQIFKTTSEAELHIRTEYDERKSNCVYGLTHLLHRPLVPLDPRANVLIASEIAALWHLPHDEMKALEIGWLKGRQISAPVEFRGERLGILLGVNKSTKAQIYQALSERTVHTLIIGKTGTGKTSFMQALVQQDIAAGNGVAVIDPLGGMVKRILQHGIPPEREQDVVVLDISFTFDEQGTFYPPPLNPLAKLNGVNPRKSAGDFATVLAKLYEDTSQTRWMQTIQAILELLTVEDHATLYDMWKVIDEREYRTKLISRFNDFNVTQRWERLERSGGLSETSIQSALWRLSQFLDVEIARASTCHPTKLDFFSLVKENKIILVSVHADEGVVPKSAQNVLGAMILSQIQLAAMSNAVTDPKTRPFMLYVDEVQDFVTSSLDELARQARQKGLGLVVATQDTSTIAPATLRALKSNLGTLVAFECNAEDAQNALDMMPGFTVGDLMNMGRYKSVISMRSEDGLSRAAFNIEPVNGPDISKDKTIIDHELDLRRKSVAKHMPMSYAEVNAWLATRYNSPPPNGGDNQDHGNDFGNPLT